MKPRLSGWSLLLTLCLALVAASPAHAKKAKKVVVISLGDDTRSSGVLQRVIEAQLGQAEGLEVISAQSMAGKLGKGPKLNSLRTSPEIRKEATNAISEAEAAYYEDRLPAALGMLTTAEVTYRRADYVEVKDWLELYLWRTAVFLAMEDSVQAELEAKKALTLHPDLEVDLSVFRPSVGELIDNIRKRGLPMIRVRIDGLPAGSRIRVDDRPVQETFRLPAGKHYLVVEADGYKRFARSFESSRSIVLSAGLPLVVPFDMELGLVELATGKSTKGERYLRTISKQFDADYVVVAASVSKPSPMVRASVWSAKGKEPIQVSSPFAASDRGRFELVRWTRESLPGGAAVVDKKDDKKDDSVVAVNGTDKKDDQKDDQKDDTVGFGAIDTGNGKKDDSKIDEVAIPKESSAWVFAARAGVAAFSRSRTLESASGPGYDISVFGAGPGVSVGLRKGLIIGDLDVSWLTYDISSVEVNHPSQGNVVSVGGGTSLRARIGGGAIYEFGNGEAGNLPGLGATVGITFESHSAEDLEEAGTRLGLFTSYSRTAVDLRAIGRYPIQVGGSAVMLHAGAEVVPFTSWQEDPEGSLGQSPSAAIAFGWRAGALWSPAEKWNVGLEYIGEIRSVEFEGQGTLPTSPLLDSASTNETLHGVVAQVHRAF